MALYYGRHKVKDYDSWRPYFDGDQERLRSVGAKCLNVMRSTDDPNNVHFVFDIPDINAFVGALQNPDAQALLQKAGVMEPPAIFRLEEMPH